MCACTSGSQTKKERRLTRPGYASSGLIEWAHTEQGVSSSSAPKERVPSNGVGKEYKFKFKFTGSDMAFNDDLVGAWTCGITVVLTTLLVAPALVPPRAPATVWLVWVCVIATVIAPIVLCAYAVASFNTTTSTAASSPAGYWGHDDAPWWHGTPGNHDFCEEVRRRTTRSIVLPYSVTSTPQRSLGTNDSHETCRAE